MSCELRRAGKRDVVPVVVLIISDLEEETMGGEGREKKWDSVREHPTVYQPKHKQIDHRSQTTLKKLEKYGATLRYNPSSLFGRTIGLLESLSFNY